MVSHRIKFPLFNLSCGMRQIGGKLCGINILAWDNRQNHQSKKLLLNIIIYFIIKVNIVLQEFLFYSFCIETGFV